MISPADLEQIRQIIREELERLHNPQPMPLSPVQPTGFLAERKRALETFRAKGVQP